MKKASVLSLAASGACVIAMAGVVYSVYRRRRNRRKNDTGMEPDEESENSDRSIQFSDDRDHTRTRSADLRRMSNQIGGHRFEDGKQGMLIRGSQVLKPISKTKQGRLRESTFFEELFSSDVPEDIELRKFLPNFLGYETVNGDFSNNTYDEVNEGQNYILLENLTGSFSKPCVMDVKIGTRSYEPDASVEKKENEIRKFPPQVTVGFRFVGMSVYQPRLKCFKTYDKLYGRSLTLDSVKEGVFVYLDNGTNPDDNAEHDCPGEVGGNGFRTTRSTGRDSNLTSGGGGVTDEHKPTPQQQQQQQQVGNKGLRLDVIPEVTSRIDAILAWFERNERWAFVASSLLIIYEGDVDAAPPARSAGQEQQQQHQGAADGAGMGTGVPPPPPLSTPPRVDVRVIDFAHVRRVEGVKDEGFIHGLRSLRSYFKQVLLDATTTTMPPPPAAAAGGRCGDAPGQVEEGGGEELKKRR